MLFRTLSPAVYRILVLVYSLPGMDSPVASRTRV